MTDTSRSRFLLKGETQALAACAAMLFVGVLVMVAAVAALSGQAPTNSTVLVNCVLFAFGFVFAIAGAFFGFCGIVVMLDRWRNE